MSLCAALFLVGTVERPSNEPSNLHLVGDGCVYRLHGVAADVVASILEAAGEAGLAEGQEAALGAGRGVRRVGEGVGASPLALSAVSGLALHRQSA